MRQMTISWYTPSVDSMGQAGRLRSLDGDAVLFRSFFERSGLRVAQLDRSLRIVLANAEFQCAFGGARRDLSGTALVDILHPDCRDRVELQLATLVEEPSGLLTERVVVRSDGRMLGGLLTALVVPCDVEPFDVVVVMLELDDRALDGACARRQMLSEVDARILEGVGAGVSTMQLAATLFLSRGGVEYHVKSLMQRFKVKNRPALISKAYSVGIFRVGYWPPQVPRNLVK